MDAESAIIGFTHSASFWIIYLIFISNIKNGVYIPQFMRFPTLFYNV